MTNEAKIAYINAQVACALIECEGMKAENYRRAGLGEIPAYDQSQFTELIVKYGIHHNAVIEYLTQP